MLSARESFRNSPGTFLGASGCLLGRPLGRSWALLSRSWVVPGIRKRSAVQGKISKTLLGRSLAEPLLSAPVPLLKHHWAPGDQKFKLKERSPTKNLWNWGSCPPPPPPARLAARLPRRLGPLAALLGSAQGKPVLFGRGSKTLGSVRILGSAKPRCSKKIFEKTLRIRQALLHAPPLHFTPCI